MATYGYSERGGAPILAVVWHGAEGHNIKKYFATHEAREVRKVSAHYAIERDGRVDAIVPEDKAAWHCGGSTIPGWTGDPNRCTIGIELACDPSPKAPGWTEAQMTAAITLGRDLAKRYELGRSAMYRHSDIDPRKSDPRNLDWRAFLDRVFGPADDRAEMERAMGEYGQGLMIPQVPGHALYDYLAARGWEHASPEFRFVWRGRTYWAQIGYSQADGRQHVAYCLDGDWGHIREFERSN